jgi:hypothetical protein
MARLRQLVPVFALACSAAVLAGCGATARPAPQVQLRISAPADGATVTSGSIAVSGNVSPAGTSVLVLGHSVQVSGGAFSAHVALAPGSNLIDVLAGAGRDRAAMTALRIDRQVLVAIPNVDNDSPSGAVQALHALGFATRVNNTDSFFDFLIPGSPGVCGTSPPGGHRVAPGTLVTVSVSKTC